MALDPSDQPEPEPAAHNEKNTSEASAVETRRDRAAKRRAERAEGAARNRDASRLSTRMAWLLTLFGFGLPFLVMMTDRRWAFSVPLGIVGFSTASVGVLRLLRGWGQEAPAKADGATHTRPLLHLLISIVGFVTATTLAVKGVYPLQPLTAAVAITATFLWVVTATFRAGCALGFWNGLVADAELRITRRYGFWLIVLGTLLYLPFLGNFGLIDPWETHYGEVAREMLARDDWISLWWAHDGWFWSKPILNFWLQGLSFKLFGVSYMPDQMLAGLGLGRLPQPEWACRMPIFLMTLLGGYTLYRAAVRPFGQRAAFLGGLILTTCPYWYILARQTMADMPYVAPLCGAMGLLWLGFQADPEHRVAEHTIALGRWRCTFTTFHLLALAILVCLLPQVAYLLSRNLTFHTTDLFGFRLHTDEMTQGSGGGNCGQPSNLRCKSVNPLYGWGQPGGFGLLWLALGVGLLFFKRNERRLQRLAFLGAWLCTTIAVMGKGAPGLVLPLGCALVFPVVTGRWRDLLRLELPALLVMLLAVALPWYVQMYMRHGYPFFERLILHDMVKRAFQHVHDTNKGDDVSFRYYVWQLGYGLFPWTGICAGGLLWWVTKRDARLHVETERSQGNTFLMVWWLLAFGMFSVTLTKFHHYIFPLVPPTAMLAGLLLERYAPMKLPGNWRQGMLYVSSMFLSVALLFLGGLAVQPGRLNATTLPSGELPEPRPILGLVLLATGFTGLLLSIVILGRDPRTAPPPKTKYEYGLGVIALAAVVGVALAGRDLLVTRKGDIVGASRLMHLFTYNYARDYPETLEFAPALLVLTALACGACALLAIRRLRGHATVLLCSVSGIASAWCMNVYLVQLAPHWGQRETMIAYYEHRSSPKDALVAYQMNWKGENFYTGNRMATFVSSGSKFKKWVEKQREKGVLTLYFTTEHSRKNSLEKELVKAKLEVLTDKRLNNKFFLARAELEPAQDTPKKRRPKKAKPKRGEGTPKAAASDSDGS